MAHPRPCCKQGLPQPGICPAFVERARLLPEVGDIKPGFGVFSTDRAPTQSLGSIRQDGGTLVMSRSIAIIVWALVLSAILHGCAHGPPLDEKSMNAMNDGQGIVLIDATISANSLITGSRRECGSVGIELGSNVDGKVRTERFDVIGEGLITGKAFVSLRPIASGEYTVLAVECGRSRFNGPHAKFQIRAGEFVNVGGLKLENQAGDRLLSIKVRRSVVEVRPQILAYVRESAPQAMAKMVNRPMTIVGPPEIQMH